MVLAVLSVNFFELKLNPSNVECLCCLSERIKTMTFWLLVSMNFRWPGLFRILWFLRHLMASRVAFNMDFVSESWV